jgi:hypothetical protein
MKKLNVIMTSLLIIGASFVFSQEDVKKEKQSIEERASKKLDKLDDEVDLTSEQRDKIATINSDYVTRLETIHSNESLEKEEKKNQSKSLKKQWREDVKNELTEAQSEKLKANREKDKTSPEERAKHRIEKIDEIVDLDQYQKADLEALHIETAQKMHDIKSSPDLDDETKKAKVKEVKEASKDRMQEILSEEQLTKLKEHRKQKKSEKK